MVGQCSHLVFRSRPLSWECWKYWTPTMGNIQNYGSLSRELWKCDCRMQCKELDPTLPKISHKWACEAVICMFVGWVLSGVGD
jgi:hypothetical protein